MINNVIIVMESENDCFFHIEKNKYLKMWYFVACCFLSWFSNTSTILVTHHRYEIMQDKTKIKVVSVYIITELMVLNIHCNKTSQIQYIHQGSFFENVYCQMLHLSSGFLTRKLVNAKYVGIILLDFILDHYYF